jgi:putative ABC transport system permease protein
MLRSCFIIAWRNIVRHKAFTAINILGLSLGMACCLFIFLWVSDEKNIDNFYHDKSQLFTVYQTVEGNGFIEGNYSTPFGKPDSSNGFRLPLEDLENAIPEVIYQAYYTTGYELPWGHPETFQFGDKMVKMEGSRAGKDFFRIFNFPFLAGNRETALTGLRDIVISHKMAIVFFGSPEKAMGKTLKFENRENFTVKAVFEDLPANTSFHFDYLLSWEAQKKLVELASPAIRSFVKLRADADPERTARKINAYAQPLIGETKGVRIGLGLQPVSESYLHGIFENGKPAGGRIEYVRIFSGVAIFILIIACINFMNLATARSVKRAKEVGLRKVVGGTRSGLAAQFFGESMLFALLAMLICILLLIILLPAFNYFTGKHIRSPLLQIGFWPWLIGLTLMTGLVAGSYPAIYLSSLRPVRVLKGVFRFTSASIWFRKSLTVFQFVLTIVLLIATIVISRQTNYVQNTHLGYDRENLVYIRIEGELSQPAKYHLFKQEASRLPGIMMIDRSSEAPHEMNFVVSDPIKWEGKDENTPVGFKPCSVGFDFVRLMKLQIAYGRDFSRETATDSSDAFLVNEEAVKQMGMKQPLGKWVSAWQKKGHIIGVLKDFHTGSLHEPIKPIIIDVKEYEYFGVIIIRTAAGKTRQALASLEKVYKELNPNFAFAWQFVDQEYQKLYASELILSRLSTLFASLAIFISCLGLLGLVMFAAEQRVKEIGIRKVLGASVSNIFGLFSKDFLALICIAFLIAAPFAWWMMHAWLNGFAYRTPLSWWIFAVAALSAALLAAVTVSYQAMKASLANPVKSLRNE